MLYQVRKQGGYFKTISVSNGPLGAAKRFKNERNLPPNTVLEVLGKDEKLRTYVVTETTVRPKGLALDA